MKRILITAATKGELSVIVTATGGKCQSQAACGEFYAGAFGSFEIITAVTGLGKVNTAMGTTFLLDLWKPDLVVNTGCGGAYPGSGLGVGDLAMASAEIYGDEGVETPTGWQSLEFIGLPLYRDQDRRFFNEFPLDPRLVADARSFASRTGATLGEGKFITVSTCSGTECRGRSLFERFGAICENMEGAAVAHVAMCHGVRCMELRGISNLVEDRDTSRWDIRGASNAAQRFILDFLPEISL